MMILEALLKGMYLVLLQSQNAVECLEVSKTNPIA